MTAYFTLAAVKQLQQHDISQHITTQHNTSHHNTTQHNTTYLQAFRRALAGSWAQAGSQV
jgi:hypothetical protein